MGERAMFSISLSSKRIQVIWNRRRFVKFLPVMMWKKFFDVFFLSRYDVKHLGYVLGPFYHIQKAKDVVGDIVRQMDLEAEIVCPPQYNGMLSTIRNISILHSHLFISYLY